MSQTAIRSKDQMDRGGEIPEYIPPKVSKLPRHLRTRAKLREKFSLINKSNEKDVPTGELERIETEIEEKRRQNLMTWYQEVSKLKKELFDMEKSLTESLVGIDLSVKKKIIKRRQMPFRLPKLSDDELERLPLYMRPKPNKPPPEVQSAQKNWAEINARSFEVLQIKMHSIRSHYSKLPGISDHYRILTTPDPRPELRTIKLQAEIQALNALSPVKKKAKKNKKKVLVTEGTVQEPVLPKLRQEQKALDSKSLRQELLGSYEKQRDGYWGLKRQKKATVIQVKMPEIIKRESKTQHVSVEKKVEILQNESKELLGDQPDEVKEALDKLTAQEENRGTSSCDVSTLAPIEEEVEELVCSLCESDIDEVEFYKNRPDLETVTMEEVLKSRLLRGYEPPEMRMPSDLNKFVFDQEPERDAELSLADNIDWTMDKSD